MSQSEQQVKWTDIDCSLYELTSGVIASTPSQEKEIPDDQTREPIRIFFN